MGNRNNTHGKSECKFQIYPERDKNAFLIMKITLPVDPLF